MSEGQTFTTFEELLDLRKEPETSCTRIDSAIRDYQQEMFAIKSLLENTKYDKFEGWDDLDTAYTFLTYTEDEFEYCRSQCEDIRRWGEDWKDLALSLIKQYEPELLLSDEHETEPKS